MRIKNIKFNDHPVLGNLELDFTNNGKAEDIIFLAGENGCGKTRILDFIYNEFMSSNTRDLKHEYSFEISDKEKSFYNKEYFQNKHIEASQNYINLKIIKDNSVLMADGKILRQNMSFSPVHYFGANEIFKCIYSSAEVNFTENKISSVTAMEIDQDKKTEKQTNISEKIKHLLIDIIAADNADLSEWFSVHKEVPPDNIIEKRMKRFKKAFDYMFKGDLSFYRTFNENGHIEIYFKRKDKKISIDDLSSGEKQIVFRGSFILKSIETLNNSIILIDEPELTLHPLWQQKIIEYFRRMCLDENGNQVCQMIVATHSPFIIHSEERKNDKVIILKRDDDGNIYESKNKEFYKCNSIETIEEAFSLNKYISDIKARTAKTIVITEGKTDYKHLANAMEKLNIKDLDIEFYEINDGNWGDSRLDSLLNNLKLIKRENKIIGIFDRDNETYMEKYDFNNNDIFDFGNNVYAFSIPCVNDYGGKISIEQYYKRKDLLKEDENGRRLFLGEEFCKESSKSLNNKYYTRTEKIQHKVDVNGIIDNKVYKNEDIRAETSIALSKNDFAELVSDENFAKDFDFSEFNKIFDIIRRILDI